MVRSRMFTSDKPTQKSKNPKTKSKNDGLHPIPTGLQSLLRLASVDPEFCEELIREREKAAHAAGIQLTRSETAMLRSITADGIRNMARGLPEPAMDRRSFLQQAARTAVLILGGAALARCTKTEKGETSPAKEYNEEQPIITESPAVVRGIEPDIPPDVEEQDPGHDEIVPEDEEQNEQEEKKEETESEGEEDSEKPGKQDSARPNLNIKRPGQHDRTRGIRSDRPPPRTSPRSTKQRDSDCESRAVTRGMGAVGGIAPDIPPVTKTKPEN